MSDQMPEDFSELLDTDAEEAVRPPPMPSGTYRAVVKENSGLKSRDKQTPGLQFLFTDMEPMSDVDVDKWQEYLSNPAIKPDLISLNDTFWLTRKSLYRLRDFCEACGAIPDGKMSKMVADAMGERVQMSVAQTVAKSGAVFNEITGYAKDE